MIPKHDITSCPHRINGWCLDCVKELYEQTIRLKDILDQTIAILEQIRDKARTP